MLPPSCQTGGRKRRARLPICGSCGASTSAKTATKAMNSRIEHRDQREALQPPEGGADAATAAVR